MNDKLTTTAAAVLDARDSWNRREALTAKEDKDVRIEGGYSRTVTFSKPHPTDKNNRRVIDVVLPKDLKELPGDFVIEADPADFVDEYQPASEVKWLTLTPRQILEAFADPDEMGEELPENVEKSLKKKEDEGSAYWGTFTIDDVEIEIEEKSGRSFGYRARPWNFTRLGQPLTRGIEKVSLKSGGWDRHDQLKRAMAKPKEARLTELVHKFEECKEYAIDRKIRKDDAARIRNEREKAAKNRVKTLKKLLPVEELTSKVVSNNLRDGWQAERTLGPSGKIEINLGSLPPELAADLLRQLDFVMTEVEETAELLKAKD